MLLYLIQTDATLAADLTAECQEVGHSVVRVVAADSDSVRELGEARPDAILISLESDQYDACLDLAEELASRRRLRGVPLVFCGGVQAALTRAQGAHPRASFARRDVLLNVLASL